MNIALVDDMEADRLQLEQLLREYQIIHHLDMNYFHFSGGEALLQEYQPFRYTVAFLDIYMNGISGIETAARIRAMDEDVILIFLTSSEAHRSDAFSVFASSYISKPCQKEPLFRVLDHIFRLRTDQGRRFTFSFNRRDYSLRFADVVSLEKDGNYLTITDQSGTVYRTRMTFAEAEKMLDQHFLTLIKGIIVNMDCIRMIAGSRCEMRNGSVFPIHVKNQKEVQQKWLNYKFAKLRNETAALGEIHVH